MDTGPKPVSCFTTSDGASSGIECEDRNTGLLRTLCV